MSDGDVGEYLTVAETAHLLRVSDRFVRALIARGELHAVRLGKRVVRVRRQDLQAMLQPTDATVHTRPVPSTWSAHAGVHAGTRVSARRRKAADD